MIVKQTDLCPCGSGKEYRLCHSPDRDRTDLNHWKGPGFPQYCYLGDSEKFTGFHFEKGRQGEIVLLNGNDEIPVGKFLSVDRAVVDEYRVTVRSLVVSDENGTIEYSGSIGVEGKASPIPILIGTSDIDKADFEARIGGIPTAFERGNWLCFLGINGNPIEFARGRDWFRYFKTSGFLVEFEPTGELSFKLRVKSSSLNLFTLALPFDNIWLSCPRILTHNPVSACLLQVEREIITWDLVLHTQLFKGELVGQRVNAQTLEGRREDDTFTFADFRTGTRRSYRLPRRVCITLSLPEDSPAIGRFLVTLERIVRTIAEGSFSFEAEPDRILEADFRDYVLDHLKSLDFYSVAEPARKAGYVDILMKREDSEAIVEFKVWGRRKYKDVIAQVLGYGTAWTTDYATVMINPLKRSVLNSFKDNARKSPGFVDVLYSDTEYKPVQKLVTYHYSRDWQRYFSVVHLIINLRCIQPAST